MTLKTIKLVRHGESLANVGEVNAADVGDHAIALSERGRQQARDVGAAIGRAFLEPALIYCSPYLRTRQTLAGILEGATLDAGSTRVLEDPRLREVEHGYEKTEEQAELQLRQTHGWFYYRFPGGESPADCFDRTSTFLETLMRQAERKQAQNALIVTHGLTLRCFVMRFLHLTVEQFNGLANPRNCDVITLGEKGAKSLFSSGGWGVEGLGLR